MRRDSHEVGVLWIQPPRHLRSSVRTPASPLIILWSFSSIFSCTLFHSCPGPCLSSTWSCFGFTVPASLALATCVCLRIDCLDIPYMKNGISFSPLHFSFVRVLMYMMCGQECFCCFVGFFFFISRTSIVDQSLFAMSYLTLVVLPEVCSIEIVCVRVRPALADDGPSGIFNPLLCQCLHFLVVIFEWCLYS